MLNICDAPNASLIKEMNFSRTEMLALSEALVDNLVVLHTIDIHKTGLEQLGRQASPPAPLQSGGGNTGSKGYIARQVEGWSKRYLAAQTEVIPAMDGVITWLVDSQPKDGLPTLIHNDYKYDNIVFNVDHPPEIVGVLDWEMCTVGDPWMDLGASLAYWAEAGDGDLAKVFNVSWLPGNLTRKEVVDRYVEKSGRQISNPVFYYVFGLFKNAVIAQQIYARWKQGHSKDPRFGELIHVIRDLSSRGRDAVQRDSI